MYASVMPHKPTPKPDDPEQFKRFIDMAREVGAQAAPETLDRVLKKVARSPKPSAERPAHGKRQVGDRQHRRKARNPAS